MLPTMMRRQSVKNLWKNEGSRKGSIYCLGLTYFLIEKYIDKCYHKAHQQSRDFSNAAKEDIQSRVHEM